jgi:hypothetical protein
MICSPRDEGMPSVQSTPPIRASSSIAPPNKPWSLPRTAISPTATALSSAPTTPPPDARR